MKTIAEVVAQFSAAEKFLNERAEQDAIARSMVEHAEFIYWRSLLCNEYDPFDVGFHDETERLVLQRAPVARTPMSVPRPAAYHRVGAYVAEASQ